MSGASSSSDFSSDEEDDAIIAHYDDARACDVLVDVVDDELDAQAPLSRDELVELLAATRPDLPEALVQAIEPVLQPDAVAYSYDAYTTALYYMATLWPETASVQRGLHRLRAAIYQRFHAAFPLTPEMYTEWISDVETVGAKLHLHALAAEDYWSVPLAVQHLQLLAENEGSDDGIAWSRIVLVMERMLTTVGQHYVHGHEIWKLCRELTGEHFDQEDGDTDLLKERAIRDLYRRQMSIPLQQNDLVMSEFRAWNEYNTLDDARGSAQTFRQAEQQQQRVLAPLLKKMNHFEERLVASLTAATSAQEPGDSTEKIWMQYLNFAHHRLTPLLLAKEDGHTYVTCMLERAIAMVCLSSTLWRRYIDHVAASSSTTAADKLKVCRRATRNASFDSSLWVDLLVVMEAASTATSDVTALIEREVFARAAAPLMDAAHSARALVAYLGLVRRQTSGSTRLSSELERAVSACRRFAHTAFPSDHSLDAAVLEFFAQTLAPYAVSDASVRLTWLYTWQDILQIRGGEAEAWISYYHEFRFTHATTPDLMTILRDRVFTPASVQVRDFPLLIVEHWLMHELTTGDAMAYAAVRERHSKLSAHQIQAVLASSSTTTAAEANTALPPTKKRKVQEEPVHPRAGTDSGESTADRPEKRAKTVADRSEKKGDREHRFTNDNTLFVCNIAKAVTQAELQALFASVPGLKDVRLVVKERAGHAKSRGMAYVQFSDDQGVVAGLALHGTELRGQAIKVERSTPPPVGSGNNSKGLAKQLPLGGKAAPPSSTLYVGGLLPAEGSPITEEQVRNALVQVLAKTEVDIKQVLILTDKRGRPKDYGLVELTSSELVDAAVRKEADLKRVLGEQVSVKVSRMKIEHVLRHRNAQKEEQAAKRSNDEAIPPSAAKSGAMMVPRTAGKRTAAVGPGPARPPHSKPAPRLQMPAKPIALTSLQPRVLRKKTVGQDTAAVASKPPSTASTTTTTATATALDNSTPKTNADFRKLFF